MSEPRRYGVIISDPAWKYGNSRVQGNAEDHYPTMTIDAIRALPVADLAADDCALFLWATWPLLVEAISVINAWGFEYVTGLPWIKIVGDPSRTLWGQLEIKAQYGIGFWVRGCSEPILIARRGKVSPPDGGFVGLLSENLHHSRKPENLYHIAERMPGPYLEMFCRRPREGWDVWGNEVASTVDIASSSPVDIPSSVLSPPAVVAPRKCVDCGGDVEPPSKYRCEACLEKR